MAAVGRIDMVQFALGIFFILKMIRQLVIVGGHSLYEPINRTLTSLIDVNFFNGGGESSQNLKVMLFYFSIHCLYKNDFTYNFSKFNLFRSLFYNCLFFF